MTARTGEVYGCAIAGNVPLAGLLASHRPAEIRVHLETRPISAAPADVGCVASSGECRLVVPWCLTAVVRGGATIDVCQQPGLSADRVQRFLLGPAIAAALHQRDVLPLHAAAVSHQGKALLIVGDSAVGKTELALALARRGWRLLADDLSAIRIVNGRPIVAPGAGVMDVWPGTRRRWSALPADACPEWNAKALIEVTAHASSVSAPVAAVCLLAIHNGPVQRTLVAGYSAFRELSRHMHLLSVVRDIGVEAAQLRRIAALLAVPVHLVRHPRRLDAVNQLCDELSQCLRNA